MKLLLTTVAAIALVSLGGCNKGGAANNVTANVSNAAGAVNGAAPASAAGKPAGDANAAAPADASGAGAGDAGGKPSGGDASTTSSGDQANGSGGK